MLAFLLFVCVCGCHHDGSQYHASYAGTLNLREAAADPADAEWLGGKALLVVFRGTDLKQDPESYILVREGSAKQRCFVEMDLVTENFIAFLVPPDNYFIAHASKDSKPLEFQAKAGDFIFVRAANKVVRLSTAENFRDGSCWLSDAANINDDEIILAQRESPISIWGILVSSAYYPAKTLCYTIGVPLWVVIKYRQMRNGDGNGNGNGAPQYDYNESKRAVEDATRRHNEMARQQQLENIENSTRQIERELRRQRYGY